LKKRNPSFQQTPSLDFFRHRPEIQEYYQSRKSRACRHFRSPASGLLIICTGRLTKTIDEIQAQEKEYTGTFQLGATHTFLRFGNKKLTRLSIIPTSQMKISSITAKTFIGDIKQLPPQH